jgi:2,3-bisphosphoglycerate-independent phosphoglycerate mutase
MDRDNRWDRTERAWRAMVLGEGAQCGECPGGHRAAYAAGRTTSSSPTVIAGAEPIGTATGDLFQLPQGPPAPDGLRLLAARTSTASTGAAPPAAVTCMMEYDPWLGLPFAFDHEAPKVTLGKILATRHPQFHCAETEKYAHVTFFFNGGRDEPYPGEERLLIPSPKVATYDLKPEMSAPAVADAVIRRCEPLRLHRGQLRQRGHGGPHGGARGGDRGGGGAGPGGGPGAGRGGGVGYSVILSADHGNCDEMVDPVTGEPHTQHTTYPVPCLVVDEVPWRLSTGGGIKDLAPTVLSLMGLPWIMGLGPSIHRGDGQRLWGDQRRALPIGSGSESTQGHLR